jgi:1-acyl-sn-glycerol-3-phosphate acyltransferase
MQWPELPAALPRHQNPGSQKVARWLLKVLGWKISGQLPNIPKMVVAVAPHTSNWDFILTMSASLAMGVQISFLGKHSIFVWPLKKWLLAYGGIPVERSQHHGIVGQVVAEFTQREQLVFGVSPEGTRKKVTQWKTGFWHIAREAQVPIQLLGIDFATKQIVFGPQMLTSDDFANDFAQMRLFFQQMTAKYPENA